MMIAATDEQELIRECRDRRTERGMQVLTALCARRIEGWRVELETARPEQVQALQGRIRGMRELLESIEPREERRQPKGGYA
jgi:polyhydroxyalkanoate synthesis regulator phasin